MQRQPNYKVFHDYPTHEDWNISSNNNTAKVKNKFGFISESVSQGIC